MTLEELTKQLDVYGQMLGCRNDTSLHLSLGWITIARRRVSPSAPCDPHTEPERFAKWRDYARHVKQYPYLLNVYEVSAAAYEAETNGTIDYMGPEDYGKRENYYLSSLVELPELLAKFTRTVDDLIPQKGASCALKFDWRTSR